MSWRRSGSTSKSSGVGGAGGRRRRVSKPKVDTAALNSLFDTLRDADSEEDEMTAVGIVEMCSQLGIEPTSIELFLIGYKFDAQAGGRFTRTEFTSGMTKLGCSSFEELRSKLPRLKSEVMGDPYERKAFHKAAFLLTREGTAKLIPKELAVALLGIVVNDSPFLAAFTDFLNGNESVTHVTQDQFCQFLEFSLRVKPDLSDYDDSAAWPLLFDDFVEHQRENASGK